MLLNEHKCKCGQPAVVVENNRDYSCALCWLKVNKSEKTTVKTWAINQAVYEHRRVGSRNNRARP